MSIPDQAIVYSLAGYIARSIIKCKPICEGCESLLSPGKVSMTPDFDDKADPTKEEFEAKEEFLKSISRGGLLRPSDVLYITCCHGWKLLMELTQKESNRILLMSSYNPRTTFVEVLAQKLESATHTRYILETRCINNHPFKDHLKQISQTQFNLFAKNFTAEANSKIHKNRKRSSGDPKKSSTARKLKKLTSS